MDNYNYDRPYIRHEAMSLYTAIDVEEATKYGKTVRATELSNIEYKHRFDRMSTENNMKPPPRTGRIFGGYLVVRKLGTKAQYETWMPPDAFEEIYTLQQQAS